MAVSDSVPYRQVSVPTEIKSTWQIVLPENEIGGVVAWMHENKGHFRLEKTFSGLQRCYYQLYLLQVTDWVLPDSSAHQDRVPIENDWWVPSPKMPEQLGKRRAFLTTGEKS